ncbi:hypothetical protein GCM10019059_42730 [Camelimonas fluminis]|uniref:Uncharacterized protein n=1 Tax=Camelimonas fluminis TaxID=1576911 RepID=A0ABV7UJS3_9HYPH|nr:hypothetical protein [Camelimonas fluminis]GHE79676.1 hypothetical protein GCM10019059_42730 [Camelimonas fluminis]
MTEHEALLQRLKAEQREIILRAARAQATPARSEIQRIGELELAIGAVEQQLNEADGEP